MGFDWALKEKQLRGNAAGADSVVSVCLSPKQGETPGNRSGAGVRRDEDWELRPSGGLVHPIQES